MRRQLAVFALGLYGVFLAGCQSPRVLGTSPFDATRAAEATVATMSLAAFQKELSEVPVDAKAARLAEQLVRFDLVRLGESQREEAALLVGGLAKRLRVAVQKEAKALHDDALKAPTYAAGSKKAAEAGAIIALFPLSDDQDSFFDADALAQEHSAVINQLGLIRRKRYNQWALVDLQNAQQKIDDAPYPGPITMINRDEKKRRWHQAHQDAAALIQKIEPTLLEPAVAPFYAELLSQLGMGQGDDKKSRLDLLNKILDPDVPRTLLDKF